MELLLGVLGNEGCGYFTQTEIDAMSTSKSSQSRVNNNNDDDDDDDSRWRRTLRTYIRNTFRFHQQTIYDIIDHNYRDWDDDESSTGSTFSGDTDRPSVQRQQQQRQRQQTVTTTTTTTTGDTDRPAGSSRRRLESLAALITDAQYVAPTVDLAAQHAVCGQSPADTFLYSLALTPQTDCGGRRQATGSRRRRHPDLLAYVFE